MRTSLPSRTDSVIGMAVGVRLRGERVVRATAARPGPTRARDEPSIRAPRARTRRASYPPRRVATTMPGAGRTALGHDGQAPDEHVPGRLEADEIDAGQ